MKATRKKSTVPPRSRAGAAPSPDRPKAKSSSAVATPPVAHGAEAPGTRWGFLTNHTHVLVLLSRNPSLILREVALQIGITERAVQRIIADLESGGVIEREKVGRQNHYQIRGDQPLRHAHESRRTIGDLLALINRVDR